MSTAKTFIKIIILFHLTFITHHCVAMDDGAHGSDKKAWYEKFALYKSSQRNYIVHVNGEPPRNVLMTSQLIRAPLGPDNEFETFDIRRSTSTLPRHEGSLTMASPPEDLPEEGAGSVLQARIHADLREHNFDFHLSESHIPSIDYDQAWGYWGDDWDSPGGDIEIGSTSDFPFIKPYHLMTALRAVRYQNDDDDDVYNPGIGRVLLPVSPIPVGNYIISPAIIIDQFNTTESAQEFDLSGMIYYIPETGRVVWYERSDDAEGRVVYRLPPQPRDIRQVRVSVRVRIVNDSVVVVSLSSQEPVPAAASDVPSVALPAFSLDLVPEEMPANASSADDESNRVPDIQTARASLRVRIAIDCVVVVSRSLQ